MLAIPLGNMRRNLTLGDFAREITDRALIVTRLERTRSIRNQLPPAAL